MKTRVQQIVEYLATTRLKSTRDMFAGLDERWPDVTQAEFETAYAMEKVRFLDEVEKILVGLGTILTPPDPISKSNTPTVLDISYPMLSAKHIEVTALCDMAVKSQRFHTETLPQARWTGHRLWCMVAGMARV